MITIIATAVVSILTALGLPQLYKHLTETKKITVDAECKKKLNIMEVRMKELTTGVDMMLTILESEFDKESGQYIIIQKVKAIIKNGLSN